MKSDSKIVLQNEKDGSSLYFLCNENENAGQSLDNPIYHSI
jgi:hypothetical protein